MFCYSFIVFLQKEYKIITMPLLYIDIKLLKFNYFTLTKMHNVTMITLIYYNSLLLHVHSRPKRPDIIILLTTGTTMLIRQYDINIDTIQYSIYKLITIYIILIYVNW